MSTPEMVSDATNEATEMIEQVDSDPLQVQVTVRDFPRVTKRQSHASSTRQAESLYDRDSGMGD